MKIKYELTNLDKLAHKYFYRGYDIMFLHGWFCAYLSAPSDSEDDCVIPSYLILNEEKIDDEKRFSKFIDELMLLYSDLAENIYEKNKLIKPLISLNSANNFDLTSVDDKMKINLLVWLYGYMCGYLVIGVDITEYCSDDKLLEDKFYPALYTLCVIFLLLDQQIDVTTIFDEVAIEDYLDVKADILDLWESVDNGPTLLDAIQQIELDAAIGELVDALNAIFYVIRVADENRYNQDTKNNTLLNRLVMH